MIKRIREVAIAHVLLSCSVAWGQTLVAQDDLSLTAKSAIQEMNRAIDAAKKKAVVKLKTAMKDEMHSGRLERANQINALILQLSDLERDNLIASAASDNSVVGEWKRRDGIGYTFKPDYSVELDNNWSGTWREDGTKLTVELKAAKGKPVERSLKHFYDLPVQRQESGQVIWMMAGQVEGLTLIKKAGSGKERR